MMYHQKLVSSLKANNKILREFKDTVYIPFSAEYSILIKNLNTVRAVVNVYIDGENQTPSGLVVNAGSEIELERSVKNGNLTEGNKFKFIERTGAVEQHRGVKLEDGIIRIEYQFERPPMRIGDLSYLQKQAIFGPNGPDWSQIGGAASNDFKLTASGSAGIARSATYSAVNNVSIGTTAVAQSFNDAGITVAGSKSTQKFSTTYMGTLEDEKHTIVLKLLGETPDNKPVLTPVTVKTKPKCTTCGKQNKATAKFCTECGTHLEIFA